jgi:hypothetical protein
LLLRFSLRKYPVSLYPALAHRFARFGVQHL